YDNLSNEQIADAKFEKAYAYFNLNQYTNAKPLFDEIHQLPDNKYFIAANYYYGVIAYKEKQYESALGAFKAVENVAEYKGVVPYYIAEIYYLQGNKESALQYGESILNKGIETYYNKQLSLLIGQLYFEKADYKKGLPLLEEYVNSSTKVSKEILYELSYSYYKEGKFANAIEGFKQLSNEKDSMGQNSMYVLGDLYLRTNNKANARTAFQYAAANNSNAVQQKVAKFNYAKLSYELGYQDVALNEMRHFIDDYPNSIYVIEAKEILVNVLANTNNFREALQLYQSFDKPTLAMQKAYPRILFGRAVELVNDQQLNEADQLLSTIINSINAGNLAAPANFWKGEIAYRQQRYDEAIRFTTAYLQSNAPASGEANATTARYNTAYSFYHKENYQQALIYFQQITKTVNASSSPIEQDAYLRSADCYFMLRDFAMADKLYESIISVAPGQAAYAMFQKGMIAGIKNSNEKIRILNALNKQYPANSFMQEVNMEIANTYIANEKFGEALPYLKLVLSSSENGLKPKAWLKLGLAHYNNNNNKEALAAYQQLLEKYPQSAESEEAMANIKDIYLEEGKPDEYLAFMKKNGITVSVSEADSLSYTAAFLRYQKNDCAASITALSNYLQNYPDGASSIEANYYRALCYKKNKEWQKAIDGFVFVNSKGLNKFYETATLEAAQLYYFELKDYANAKKYFELLRANAVDQSLLLEAYRGLVRSYYQLKDYSQSNTIATELLNRKGISTDDRSIGLLVLAKSQQQQNDCPSAITTFKQLTAINKSAWGAEARYEIANCYFTAGNFSAAEKAATQVIKETGSYDWWVTKSYILLGDIFLQQKDYFNAKATFESVAKNAAITELKNEAQQKLERAVAEEKQNSKIGN
ncbi:MAG: tetratricopeptide repeat protein, partial [Ferruginibacter sp.]